jgi:hypothetical protein
MDGSARGRRLPSSSPDAVSNCFRYVASMALVRYPVRRITWISKWSSTSSDRLTKVPRRSCASGGTALRRVADELGPIDALHLHHGEVAARAAELGHTSLVSNDGRWRRSPDAKIDPTDVVGALRRRKYLRCRWYGSGDFSLLRSRCPSGDSRRHRNGNRCQMPRAVRPTSEESSGARWASDS